MIDKTQENNMSSTAQNIIENTSNAAQKTIQNTEDQSQRFIDTLSEAIKNTAKKLGQNDQKK